MRIKKNISIRKIADEYIMIADTADSLDYTKAISLNETAAYLIEASHDQDIEVSTWVELLLEHYEVSPERAQADAEALLDTLLRAGVVE